MTIKLHCVRLARTRDGRAFPFDRIYLTTYDNQPYIGDFFDSAIVVPLIGGLRAKLKEAIKNVGEETVRKKDTYGIVSTQKTLLDMIDDQKARLLCIVPLKGHYAVNQDSASFKRQTTVTANYLLNHEWQSRLKNLEDGGTGEPSPFKEVAHLAYLRANGKDVQPVCKACPRYWFQQAGDCRLGDRICLENLPLAKLSNYNAAMTTAAAKAPPDGNGL